MDKTLDQAETVNTEKIEKTRVEKLDNEMKAASAVAGRNLQSYLSTVRLRKLTVVFEYCEAKETYSRI